MMTQSVDPPSGHADSGEDASVWLTRTEAAVYADIDIRTLDRLLAKGVLTKFRYGRRVRIHRKELDGYLKPKIESKKDAD